LTWSNNGKGKGRYTCSSSWEPHLRATGHHLPYGITQCYLPPDTSDCNTLIHSHFHFHVYRPTTYIRNRAAAASISYIARIGLFRAACRCKQTIGHLLFSAGPLKILKFYSGSRCVVLPQSSSLFCRQVVNRTYELLMQ